MIKKVFVLFFLITTTQLTFAQAQSAKARWIDSVFHTLDINEKIGQVFMVPVSANIDAEAIHEIENRIKSHEVGGLIFKNIGPVRQVSLINHFQSISRVPLFIAQEAELSSLLDSAIVFPPPVVLGAIQNDTLLYRLGSVMARQLKMMGVNLVFSPITRIAEPTANPNPVAWSFGQDKVRVTQKSLAMMRGFQDNGIISCAQYFPLKTSSVANVRNDLPAPEAVVDSVQRFPYTTLIAQGLKGVSPSASEYPMLFQDDRVSARAQYSAATLTTLYTGDWLRKNLSFNGLTFVDIRRMENLSEKEKDGDAELFAFQSGNDVLMYPAEPAAAIRKIKRLLKKEDAYEQQLDATVRKILEAKFDAGLWQKAVLSQDNLVRRLNNPEARVINQKIYESAVTVVRNQRNSIPVKVLENKKFAYVSLSANVSNYAFYEYLNKYVNTTFFLMEDKTDQRKALQDLSAYQVIIIGVFPETPPSVLKSIQTIIRELPQNPEIIFSDFGHPTFLSSAHQLPSVITAYNGALDAYKAVPQVIFGGLAGRGTLPFAPSQQLPVGTGVKTDAVNRLAYSIPEDVKMDSRIMISIDSIAREAIRIGATPGCQVFVARKGKVIYEKSFGHFTYDNNMPVTDQTIYDLASITKVAATLQTAMFMYEKGMIDLHKKVSYYLPELRNTNKKDITFVDMLTHQSGLIPFLPMYPHTMKDTTYLPQFYSRAKSEKYPLQVSSNLYGSIALRDSVWRWVVKSKMGEKPARTPYTYKYSDFGFLILQRVAETLLNQQMDEFMMQNFYEPLGASTLGFNPLQRFPKQAIAPTEDDKIYRRTFVSGTVHDERAAMMGGVAGHAGLFGTAGDLGKLGQMLLQQGTYGGVRYFKPETVQLFTTKKYRSSRRGIGWDKPVQSDSNSPTSLLASPLTFGHTGFTGTCIWVDPQFDLVYVFLSNRVYPDRNAKLINANIRSRIQDVIYKSIFNYVDEHKPAYIVNDFAINSGPARPLE
jgi:beta-N-acetylhexosaminidase